ncbi:hypothetical protein C0J52_08429 [Blattella germanica]|nr:hypothetical protein C0J52_08429 [Blattella germanica]
MLEDFTMEKKPPGRSVQVPGKANGTELKKSQADLGKNLGMLLRLPYRYDAFHPENDIGRMWNFVVVNVSLISSKDFGYSITQKEVTMGYKGKLQE